MSHSNHMQETCIFFHAAPMKREASPHAAIARWHPPMHSTYIVAAGQVTRGCLNDGVGKLRKNNFSQELWI
ncbi:hypothetical protein TUM12147_23090 [Citrobacter europaeus]|nr:hypothetical protein TUM12147_23090 [Citrobacter europaeus]GIZ22782.1 hypothetical protein TUM12148_14460 [Citrobacter europaeus]